MSIKNTNLTLCPRSLKKSYIYVSGSSVVAPTFLSGGTGNFPVASSHSRQEGDDLTARVTFPPPRRESRATGTRNWKVPCTRKQECLRYAAPVTPTFLSAGAGNFPVASSFAQAKRRGRFDGASSFSHRPAENRGQQEHGTGKFREPANKNVCATPRP